MYATKASRTAPPHDSSGSSRGQGAATDVGILLLPGLDSAWPPSPATQRLQVGFVRRYCYDRRMTEVASRELRNNTAGVLQRVQAGEDVVITVNGRAVARLVPLQPVRRRWVGRDELARRLRLYQADPGLRADLAELAGETTEDLGPIR